MFESPNDAFVSKPSRHARRRDRRRLFCRSIPGGSETSSTGSLGLHIVTILEHPVAPALLAGKIR